MSSTDAHAGIDRLFDEIVLPLHEKIKQEGIELFPPGPDPSAESYYIRRAKTRMTREDFEAASYDDAKGLADALRGVWQNSIPAELAASAEKVAETASKLEKAAETQGAEVSEFIYVMF